MQILTIRPGALGDFIVTIPVLQSLMAAYPGAEHHVMAPGSARELLGPRYPHLRFHHLDLPGLHTFFSEALEPDARLAGFFERFDLILSYWGDAEAVFSKQLARCRQGRLLCRHPKPVECFSGHVTEHLFGPLKESGMSLVSENPLIPATQAEISEARAALESLGVREPFVVCHPGSGSPTKNWPADRFVHLAHELERNTDSEVLFVEGPADEETAVLVRQAIGSESKWLTHPPLGELLGLLSLAALYIGNDSGITHLAGAAGCPVLAIFGPTRSELWGPIGEKVRTLGGSSELSKLSIEKVAALALSILQS